MNNIEEPMLRFKELHRSLRGLFEQKVMTDYSVAPNNHYHE